ncbi:hypothetical protein VST7929_02986 [Vibrio stylophorae]|uniref:Zinc-ribbon 15 domain-containing protein n=1 Tax=Vibrio stylophorae TaxID=659351 RepID=A0ABN8DXI2_9VIBR|nr:hypothetical protein [Vibrio stylophorae]CAH0535413.1 hypothetical protein VST7929_02986 [Vibrio stylophorae]
MIFFGTKGKTVAGPAVDCVTCPHCGKQQHQSFGLLRYFHIYAIPTWMTARQVGLECLHCKYTLIGRDVPDEISHQLKPMLFPKRRVLPLFTGLILLCCLVAGMVHIGHQEELDQAQYLAAPALHDIYIVDITSGLGQEAVQGTYKYAAMRIVHIDDHQYEFALGNMVFEKVQGVRQDIRKGKTNTSSYYDSETLLLSHAQIRHLKQIGALKAIERR